MNTYIFYNNISFLTRHALQSIMNQRVYLIITLVILTLSASAVPLNNIDSLKRSLEISPDTTRVKTMVNISFQYVKSNPDSANYWSMRAIKLAKRTNHQMSIARSNYSKALIYSISDQNDQALELFGKVLDIYQQHNYNRGITDCYNNIGRIYKSQEEYDKALYYYNKSLTINRNLAKDKTRSLAKIYNNIGNIYLKKQLYDTAIIIYTKAQKYSIKDNYNEGLAIIENNLGMVEYEMHENEKALGHFQKALDIFSVRKNYLRMIQPLINMGQTYTRLRRWISANHRFDQALELATMLKNQGDILLIMEQRSNMLAAQGYYRQALELYHKHTQLKDSLNTKIKSEQLARMQAKFEAHQKNREIEQLQEHQRLNKVKRNFLILCLILVIIFTIILLRKQQKKIHKDKEIMNINKRVHETQKALMQTKLKYKNTELQNFAIHIIQKNELLSSIKENLSKVKNYSNNENRDLVKKVHLQIHQNLQMSKDTELFQKKISRTNADFFQQLSTKYTSLTEKEKKLCALLKLNLSSKEIASLNNITERAVVMARYRLRKKFQLLPEQKLSEFLNKI